MKRVELSELPDRLALWLNKDKFLFAYSLPDRGRYVARHVRPDGRAEEIEYDVGLDRLLTVDERRRALPEEGRTALPEERVTVSSRYFLDEETARLNVALDVLDEAGNKLVGLCKQVYDPTPWDLSLVVKEALKTLRFPAEYAAWPREQQVSYWATTLHRFRRVHGESGWDEDEIYTRDLVHDMERLDPRVRDLLPDILTLVGRLEQTAPAEAMAAFTARTGIAVQ